MGRATQGVRIIKLGVGDRVSDLAKLARDDEVEKEIASSEVSSAESKSSEDGE